MYELTITSIYTTFTAKLTLLNKVCDKEVILMNKLFHAIGTNHIKISKLLLFQRSNISVIYTNINSIQTISIELRSIDVDYDINIFKGNRVYRTYIEYINKYTNNIHTNISNKINCMGISIKDIFKHFYHTGDIKNLEEESDYGKKINYKKLIIKSLSYENITNKCVRDDILGTFEYESLSLELWKNHSDSFEQFCKKLVLIPSISIKQNTLVSPEFIIKLLSSKSFIVKLIKYFLFNEDPETIKTINQFYFNEPTLVPDALIFLEKNNYINKLDFSAYYSIMKKPNKREQSVLDNFNVMYLDNIQQTLPNYSPIVYRKIYIRSWGKNGLYSDSIVLTSNIYTSELLNASRKYKYMRKNSTKQLNEYNTWQFIRSGRKHRNYDNYHFGHKYNRKIYNLIKYGLNDYYDEIDNFNGFTCGCSCSYCNVFDSYDCKYCYDSNNDCKYCFGYGYDKKTPLDKYYTCSPLKLCDYINI